MKATINGKRYDSDNCHTLASYDHQNNGNYSGTTYLIEASNGELLKHTNSNGQDCYLRNSLFIWDSHQAPIDEFDDLKDKERLVQLGIIEIID